MSLGYFQSIKKPKKCQRRYSTETFKTFPNVGNTDIDTYSKLDHEGVYNAADHGDEVKGVPVVFEVTLERRKNMNIRFCIHVFKINAELEGFVDLRSELELVCS